MRFGSLFSGIGGLDLGLERAGMECVWQCEADPYCRAVLRKHWPDIPCYPDVRTIGAELEPVDLLCGGFPCQPVSLAGRRRGAADERWLWPEFARLIRVLRPRYALMENVPGLLAGDGMAEVLGDLAACGYDAEWQCVSAAHLAAPHLRYRVFIVAYPEREPRESRGASDADEGPRGWDAGRGGERQAMADAERDGLEGQQQDRSAPRPALGGGVVANPDREPLVWAAKPRRERFAWELEPNVGRVANGVPSRVDRLRALGNAVVPQVAEWVGRQILEAEGV